MGEGLTHFRGLLGGGGCYKELFLSVEPLLNHICLQEKRGNMSQNTNDSYVIPVWVSKKLKKRFKSSKTDSFDGGTERDDMVLLDRQILYH